MKKPKKEYIQHRIKIYGVDALVFVSDLYAFRINFINDFFCSSLSVPRSSEMWSDIHNKVKSTKLKTV